jgi:hypothetical protein
MEQDYRTFIPCIMGGFENKKLRGKMAGKKEIGLV